MRNLTYGVVGGSGLYPGVYPIAKFTMSSIQTTFDVQIEVTANISGD